MRTCPLVTTLLIKQLASGIAIDESSPAALVPTFTLANNITIPLIGLGSASGVGYLHVDSAIKAGYRFIDTAQSASWGYKEHEVGNAVFDAKRRWEDWKNGDADDYVFVQTKIHPQDLGYKSTKAAISRSSPISVCHHLTLYFCTNPGAGKVCVITSLRERGKIVGKRLRKHMMMESFAQLEFVTWMIIC
eukprot:CCRYP_011160-RA/>CCRYP_011160-RA protein AED:0.35 eAED:0.35 QI:0/-1/0/1/-1/1/1/0/189